MSNIAARFWEAIEPRLNRRSVAFLLSLLLSGLFWLLISLSKEYVDEVQIPVQYNGIPDDVLVANEPELVVTAEVRGFGFDLMWNWLKIESLKLPIDASPSNLPTLNGNGSEWHYFVTNSKNNRNMETGDDQVQILNVSPDTIFFLFKPKYMKLVPVRLDADISFQKQFGMDGTVVIEPDSVMITGPREVVDTIRFILTDKQTFTDLDESVTAEVGLIGTRELSNISFDKTSVRVEVNVVEYTEGTVSVPVSVNSDGRNSVQIFPQEVELKYLVPLPDFDKIQPAQFEVSVTLDDEAKHNSRLIVAVDRFPANVKQVRVNPPQVEFIIQK